MSIRSTLKQGLKEAIKTNNIAHKNVIRCLCAKAEEYLCARNIARDLDDDAIYAKVIEIYRKSILNALALMENDVRARNSELAESYRFEVDFCTNLLPKEKTDDEVLPIVKQKMEDLNITKTEQIGKLIGAVLKDGHQGISASTIKRLATQIMER